MKNKIRARRAVEEFRDQPRMLENRKGKLRLDMNESTVGCSPRVRAALRRLDAEDIAMYPEKENATARIAPFFGVMGQETVLTGGIDEALRLVADVFIERGRSVLLVEPTFPMYRFHAEQRDARIRTLFCDNDMRFPLDDVLRALQGAPSVLFLANPNNPTGALLDKRTLARILDTASGTLVVVDEAYFEFSGVTVLPWIRRRRNLVVTRTFSKASGLAGLRIGCLFAQRDTASLMKRAQGPFPLGIPQLVAAEAALKDRAFVGRSVAEVTRGRKLLESGLRELALRIFPSAANFVLVDLGARGPEIVRALAQRGILIRDQAAAIGRVGLVRITAGTPPQMRHFLSQLKKVL
jgi:histidinol-phosphate aminotransferase